MEKAPCVECENKRKCLTMTNAHEKRKKDNCLSYHVKKHSLFKNDRCGQESYHYCQEQMKTDQL